MDEFDEIYAACIVEYARRQEGEVLSGPFYVIGKDARDAFDLPFKLESIKSAISILADLDVLTQYSRDGMPTFYRIDAKKFDAAMRDSGLGIRHYRMLRSSTKDTRDYEFLEAFNDLGPRYLDEALATYEELQQADAEVDDVDSQGPDERIDSAARTGLAGEPLSEAHRIALVRELDRAEAELDNSGASQHERAQARALIIAARTLAEAPDPPVDVIWELVNRANAIAGIASLFVSILALFTAAAH